MPETAITVACVRSWTFMLEPPETPGRATDSWYSRFLKHGLQISLVAWATSDDHSLQELFALVHGTMLPSDLRKCIRPATQTQSSCSTQMKRLENSYLYLYEDTTSQGCGTIPFWNAVKAFWKREEPMDHDAFRPRLPLAASGSRLDGVPDRGGGDPPGQLAPGAERSPQEWVAARCAPPPNGGGARRII